MKESIFPNRFIILDIETTELSHHNSEITEIGAIIIDSNTMRIEKEFSKLIDIEGYVPNFITKLTGISKNMLSEKGLRINDALSKLNDFCGELDIYAHNSSFDKRFIRYNLNKNSISFIETNWIDTISFFKKYLPGRKTYKLESLIRDLNVGFKEHHRALDDAKMTLECIKKIAI